MTTDTTTKDRLIGETIDGRFRLDDLLGKGGMGRVYAATQLSMGRKVAVKVLREEISDSEIAAKRFFREAQVAAGLRHPNIVSIIDYGRDDVLDALYIVMEYVEGRPLSSLTRRGRLRLPLALHVARQVCSGLSEAHAAGIVHRDLKPDNVMLEMTAEGAVSARLLDFGIALPSGKETRFTATGAVVGTPHYMAPEQAQDQPVDGRADLHALGVMLYEMLTGRLPWVAETPMAVLLKVVTSPPPPLEEALPPGELPPAPVRELLDSLLAKSPEGRPQSASVVGRELESLIQELGATLAFSSTLEALSDAEVVDRASDELAMFSMATLDSSPAGDAGRRTDPAEVERVQASAVGAPAPPPRKMGWYLAALPAFLILLGGAVALIVSQTTRRAADSAPVPAPVIPIPLLPVPVMQMELPPAQQAVAAPVEEVTDMAAAEADFEVTRVASAQAVSNKPVSLVRKEPPAAVVPPAAHSAPRELEREVTPPVDDQLLEAKIRRSGGFCPDHQNCTFSPAARAAVCRTDSSCEFDCAAGGCSQTCEGEAECRYDCAGGGCDQFCSGQANCKLTCSGGGCTQFCHDEADCDVSCTGQNCNQRSFDDATVRVRD